ncbi:MAG: hypothetical protein KF841_09305 [Phycisphaerae bacterium]|nr:hypothetical protein [Phycisphaerae bacterium]
MVNETAISSSGQSIYQELADYQRTEAWFGQALIETLQLWTNRFIAEFKLDIPEVVLSIDALPCTRYGQFREGHNGLGLRGEITLNAKYLDGSRPMWEVLGTLLHELLHGWQQAHGSPGKGNHHNREFREKAAQLGLLIDKKGLTGYAAFGPFKTLLIQSGIDAPSTETPVPSRRPRGTSKLKKWSCACTNVWCAVSDLLADCQECGSPFIRSCRARIIEVL